MNFVKKNINDILIHLAFAFWLVLACCYYQERIYSDAGFYLAKVVHYETFWIEVNRFIRAFSQWLPLLLVKIGAPMKWVILGYSIGHVLFFYGCYLLCRWKFENKDAGWVLLLMQSIGILYGFCAPGFEFYYVAAFLVIWAIALEREHSWKNIAFQLFLLFFIVTGYRTALIFIGGIFLLHMHKNGFKYWKYYTGISCFVLLCFVFKKMTATSYEQEKMKWFLHLLFNHDFDSNYYYQLLGFYWEYYKELWLLVLASLVIYIKEKKYKLAVGYILFLLLTQYVVSLSYTNIKHSRYQEQCYFPLIVAACYPLLLHAKQWLSAKSQQKLQFFIFALVIYRLVLIAMSLTPYTERVKLMHRLIEACQERTGNKFIIDQDINPSFADMTFTFNMETMLLSALNPKGKTIHIIREGEWEYKAPRIQNLLADTNKFLFTYRGFYDRTDSVYLHQNANKKYYNFPAGKYRKLNGAVDSIFDKALLQKSLKLEAYPRQKYSKAKEYSLLVKLDNKGILPLNSKQIKIAYHWLKEDKVVHWEGIRSPLELDLNPKQSYYQKIRVRMPQKAGRYTCQLAIIADGKNMGWIALPNRFEVSVD